MHTILVILIEDMYKILFCENGIAGFIGWFIYLVEVENLITIISDVLDLLNPHNEYSGVKSHFCILFQMGVVGLIDSESLVI